jgi:hypothetical protein
MNTNNITDTQFIIEDTKGGWFRASDEMPNTHWTPNRAEAQTYPTREAAQAEIATLDPSEQRTAAVVELANA